MNSYRPLQGCGCGMGQLNVAQLNPFASTQVTEGIPAPTPDTPAGQSSDVSIRYVQSILQRRGIIGLDSVDGTWNYWTMKYLDSVMRSWRTMPGGAYAIAAALLLQAPQPIQAGMTPGTTQAPGVLASVGISNTMLAIIGGALAVGLLLIVASKKK